MVRHIVLDSTRIGIATRPNIGAETRDILRWVADCRAAGNELYIPEIIDYEIRREFIRAGKTSSLTRLEVAKTTFRFIPVDSASLLLAADLWAAVRRGGYATGHPERLDIDVILAAQALLLPVPPGSLVVATSNVRHLSRFVAADEWRNIQP